MARRLSKQALIEVNRQLAEIGERICHTCGWRGEINRENFRYSHGKPSQCRKCYNATRRRRYHERMATDPEFRRRNTERWLTYKREHREMVLAMQRERDRARRLRKKLVKIKSAQWMVRKSAA